MTGINYTPQAGQKNLTKYPFVGNNYHKYGEQAGFIYDPYSDKYYRDPRATQKQYEEEGLIEKPKKPPGLGETLLPVAAVGGAYALSTETGKALPGLLGIGEAGKAGAAAAEGASAAGSGITAATTATQGANAASSGALAAPEIVSATRVPAAEGGLFELGGIGSPGNAILPAAGVMGIGDVLLNNRQGTRGVLQGAASGAAIGSYFGPVGIGVGAGVGGLIGLGQSVWGDKDRWKEEKDNLIRLKEKGVFIPDELIASMPNKGRSKEELIQIEEQKIANGQYGNVDFAKTRDEKYLKPLDIVGYSAFAEHDPNWFKKPMEERVAIAQKYLDAGAVSEGKGQIKLDHSKVEQTPPPQDFKKLPATANSGSQALLGIGR